MPIVHAEIWKGKSQDTKKALAESLTNAVVQHIGCPPHAVTIIIDEVDKANWFTGGKDANELVPTVSDQGR